MNKPVELHSTCPCGTSLDFFVEKPKAFTPHITKVECPKCHSKFLIKAKIGKHDRGVDIDVGVQELSPECENLIKETLDAAQDKSVELARHAICKGT